MNLLLCIARVTAVALLFCTTAYATVMRFESHVSEPQNSPSDTPEVNPAPHRVVTIRGQKDRRIEAWFVVTYSTTNDACRAQTIPQLLSGAPKVPQTIYDYVRVPSGQTTFSVRFFLDKYAEGRCGWSPIAIGRAAFLPEESSGPTAISGFVVIRNDGSDHISAQYHCRRRINVPNVAPHFYLECLPTGPTIRSRDAITPEGGTVEVEMPLEPWAGRQTPDSASRFGA